MPVIFSFIYIKAALQRTVWLAFVSVFLLVPLLLQAANGISPQFNKKENAGAADQDNIELSSKLTSILNNESSHLQAIQEGKKASFFCANCHGIDGNSKFMEVPNLAGQNPSYLLTQLLKFSNGQRRNAFMERLVKELSGDDLVNISVYFASKAVSPKSASNIPQVTAGKHYSCIHVSNAMAPLLTEAAISHGLPDKAKSTCLFLLSVIALAVVSV